MLDAAFRDLGLRGAARWAQISAEHPAYWGYAGADAALCARLVEPLRAGLQPASLPISWSRRRRGSR